MRSTDFCSHEKILSSSLESGMSAGLGLCLTKARLDPTRADGADVSACLPEHSGNPFSF